jgi:hypothetical protein
MITITWKCDDCGLEKITKSSLEDGWHIDVGTPNGWGALIDIKKLRCPKCRNIAYKKWREENPDAVLMA